jgi:hypothetical protein
MDSSCFSTYSHVVWLEYSFYKNLCIVYASKHKVGIFFTFFACIHNWTIYSLVMLLLLDLQFLQVDNIFLFLSLIISILTLLHLSNPSPLCIDLFVSEFVFHGCNNIVCISMQCKWGSFGLPLLDLTTILIMSNMIIEASLESGYRRYFPSFHLTIICCKNVEKNPYLIQHFGNLQFNLQKSSFVTFFP